MECGLRAAPAHDIADKRTPVDADGNPLARDVFGWTDERVWWRNARIALDSPITSPCRFESPPYWLNASGFHTRRPSAYLASVDLPNLQRPTTHRAPFWVPFLLPFGQIGPALSITPEP